MARQPNIWQRGKGGWFYTTLKGQQIRLSKDRSEARRMLHELLSREEPEADSVIARISMRKLADLFLDESRRTKAPETYVVQKYYLQSFCDHVGRKKVRDLKVHMATAWLAEYPAWGQSTRTTAVAILKACNNWGVQQGHLQTNPIAKLKRGDFERRERILTSDEKKRILAEQMGDFRDFVFALEHTGARPFSEIARVTAAMINFRDQTITFHEHKNQKKGRARVVFLTPALLEKLRELADRYPNGPLFRTRTGKSWSKQAASKWMRKLEERLGIPRLTVYAWRHSYITDCLAKGLSASLVAQLVGNSERSIAKYYDHLDQKHDALRDAALRAVS
jgi:integrase